MAVALSQTDLEVAQEVGLEAIGIIGKCLLRFFFGSLFGIAQIGNQFATPTIQ